MPREFLWSWESEWRSLSGCILGWLWAGKIGTVFSRGWKARNVWLWENVAWTTFVRDVSSRGECSGGRFDSPNQQGSPWYCTYGVRREVTMKSTWKLLVCFWRRDYHADIPFIFIVMWPAGGSTLHGSVASAMSSWGSVPKQPKLLTLRSWHEAFHSRGSAWRVMRLVSVHFRAGSIRLSCCITRQDWTDKPGMCLWLWCWQELQ